MKNPLQMYSKIGDLKIIQIKKGKDNSFSRNNQNLVSSTTSNSLLFSPYLLPEQPSIPLYHFIGSLNKKLTTGIIISSKINQLRKDGMSFKYFRYNYLLSQDIGKLSKQPLTYEYKLSSNPLLAKKYIKIIKGYSFYDLL